MKTMCKSTWIISPSWAKRQNDWNHHLVLDWYGKSLLKFWASHISIMFLPYANTTSSTAAKENTSKTRGWWSMSECRDHWTWESKGKSTPGRGQSRNMLGMRHPTWDRFNWFNDYFFNHPKNRLISIVLERIHFLKDRIWQKGYRLYKNSRNDSQLWVVDAPSKGRKMMSTRNQTSLRLCAKIIMFHHPFESFVSNEQREWPGMDDRRSHHAIPHFLSLPFYQRHPTHWNLCKKTSLNEAFWAEKVLPPLLPAFERRLFIHPPSSCGWPTPPNDWSSLEWMDGLRLRCILAPGERWHTPRSIPRERLNFFWAFALVNKKKTHDFDKLLPRKLTYHLKIAGWKMIHSFQNGPFSGDMLNFFWGYS